MTDLTKNELILVSGGNVPTSYYMDSDVIKANGQVIEAVGSFIVGFFVGLFD